MLHDAQCIYISSLITGNTVASDIYDRIKSLEDKVLILESTSSEYLGNNVGDVFCYCYIIHI